MAGEDLDDWALRCTDVYPLLVYLSELYTQLGTAGQRPGERAEFSRDAFVNKPVILRQSLLPKGLSGFRSKKSHFGLT